MGSCDWRESHKRLSQHTLADCGTGCPEKIIFVAMFVVLVKCKKGKMGEVMKTETPWRLIGGVGFEF